MAGQNGGVVGCEAGMADTILAEEASSFEQNVPPLID
jgi:hypothetical protein